MNKFFISAALAALLLSCNNDDNVNNISTNGLKVSATIGAVTKAQKSSWANGDEMGLFVTDGTLGSPYHGIAENTNVLFSYDGSVWKSIKIPLDNSEATVFAYYPYKEANTNGISIPVESDSQTDYLWGHGDKKASVYNTNVNINMNHALSQVVFKMRRTNYTGGEGRLTKVVLSNVGAYTNLKSDGTLNLATGAVTGITTANMELTTDHVIDANESMFSAIVIPVVATAGEELKVTFTIDGNDYYYIFPAGTSWTPGYRNIYSFLLKDNNLTIGGADNGDGSGVTIEPWVDSDQGTIPLIPVI